MIISLVHSVLSNRFLNSLPIQKVPCPLVSQHSGDAEVYFSVRSANGENKGEYEGPGPIVMDPVDCVLSDWTLWGLCSKSCGDGGTKSRTRRVLLQLRLCAPALARDPS